jgi:hypothetical protein
MQNAGKNEQRKGSDRLDLLVKFDSDSDDNSSSRLTTMSNFLFNF